MTNHTIQRCSQQFGTVAVRRSDDDGEGQAPVFYEQAALGAGFTAIGRVRPRQVSAQRGFGEAASGGLPAPGEPFDFILFGQPRAPELFEDAVAAPILKIAMQGFAGAELSFRRSVPLTTCAQDIQNTCEGLRVSAGGRPLTC
jgi:hypothetical protein